MKPSFFISVILYWFTYLSWGRSTFSDNPKNWRFTIDTSAKTNLQDSLKMLGQIKFFRDKAIVEKPLLMADGRMALRTINPLIRFGIFRLNDSSLCISISKQNRRLSDCQEPQTGDDYYVVGQYLFFNIEGCLSCFNSDKTKDYCRPMFTKIFSNIKIKRDSDIKDILKQIQIKRQ